jgi:hypothetical protein
MHPGIRLLSYQPSPFISGAFKRLIVVSKHLLQDIAIGKVDSQYRDDVKELLTTVPLTTGEYAQAVTRLGNAMNYAVAGETGGACYELTMLIRNLANRHRSIKQDEIMPNLD